ncbi:glyoxylase-like metal-dependent hydrolase (beta-lactamase superfamily II) [Streptomyces griseochromogenes]|uniref:Glyoxylase-like metal-dependent hydrolase (Beta-lactamase superfamily II) n=1 Tax=Streptomyces griseochromogenes TaxID=68214 RepID=A0A1B1B856_9ACTN|nr:MBL fold metallo-hydrolase [Streptomyces griseochromogenes]ANP54969.1 MBL fold metallo-hydrolase [Streptomyces griseochromogenes]MBP2050642.1 glyoxylase-like metal-dependent hydrolase (beta-lactamase superfamily II) [Streptomyces griseochromogenes]
MTVTWEELGWERLAPGVGRCRLPGWDCTVGLVLGEGTALVVDAGSSLAEGARVREHAQRIAGRRVTHLALTHPHFDHVFGAASFAGAEVYGAVGIDAVFAYEREEMRLDAIGNGLPEADAEEAADHLTPPRHLVSGEWTLDLGDGRQVLLANVGPGHTAHDLAVLVPGSVSGGPETVFCGDLVEESGEPQAGPDAVPSRWPDALDRLLSLGGEDALYVPGHGAVVDASFVRRQRDELAARFGVS